MFLRIFVKRIAAATGIGSSLYVLKSAKERQDLFDKLPHRPDFQSDEEIKPLELKPGDWKDLLDHLPYKVSVAKKPAFQNRLGVEHNPLAHAVLVVQPKDAKKEDGYWLFGRQSPHIKSVNRATTSRFGTTIENEIDYINPNASGHFLLGKDQAQLTGAEIKAALTKTQQEICQKQFFDLFRSNCVSAISASIINMKKEVAKRTGDKEQALHNLDEMFTSTADFNFSQGIANNSQVRIGLTRKN